jgi:hypothetical protein
MIIDDKNKPYRRGAPGFHDSGNREACILGSLAFEVPKPEGNQQFVTINNALD